MKFGFENTPSTWRGIAWLSTGLFTLAALALHADTQAVVAILGAGATAAGSIGAVTRDQPRNEAP